MPLAAGYTLFTVDGPSDSFERIIHLNPLGKPAAALAIEYAIWWDWDIHHLYELEHVWVYVDAEGAVARVEGSWHGDLHELPAVLDEGHPALFSEPGKHAFAPTPDWFRERAREVRRTETRFIGVHASVLINQMFTGKIRQRVFDRTLARSYLAVQAFDPAWNFTKRFSFQADWLVTWPALRGWIPQRVNAWLERLEATTPSSSYRALRLLSSPGTLDGLREAARAGADSVLLPVSLDGERLVACSPPFTEDALEIAQAYDFCSTEPIGAFLEPNNPLAVDRLAEFVIQKKLQDYIIVTSPVMAYLKQYRERVPGGVTVLQLEAPDQDAPEAARQTGAHFVSPRWLPLDPDWIRRVHQAGLGVIGGPVTSMTEANNLQRMGVDVVWQTPGLENQA